MVRPRTRSNVAIFYKEVKQNGNGRSKRGGRPPIYDPNKHPKAAYKLVSRHGLPQQDLAEAFGVTNPVICQWKEAHPEFLNALKKGMDDFASGTIVKALAARAKGYSHPEEKIFCNSATGEVTRVETTKHYPPDPVSAIFWLVNWSRRWGNGDWVHVNRIEHTGRDGKPIQTEDAVTQTLLRELLSKADPETLVGLKDTLENITCSNTVPC